MLPQMAAHRLTLEALPDCLRNSADLVAGMSETVVTVDYCMRVSTAAEEAFDSAELRK